MKIRPAGTAFHADRQTNVTKPIVALRSSANAPQNMPLRANVLNIFDDVIYST